MTWCLWASRKSSGTSSYRKIHDEWQGGRNDEEQKREECTILEDWSGVHRIIDHILCDCGSFALKSHRQGIVNVKNQRTGERKTLWSAFLWGCVDSYLLRVYYITIDMIICVY